MKKRASANYWKLNGSALFLLFAVALVLPQYISGQGYYKVDVRNTNCPVSHQEADIWFFGLNAGIDFRNDQAQPVLNNYILGLYENIQGSASICDSTGNLLMVTNGQKLWNKLENVMSNGDSLHGSAGSTMPAIIIPKPGDPSIYYVFTVDQPYGNPALGFYGLQYSEVNLSLDNGLGAVTSLKNKPLLPAVSEKISAVKSNNGEDYWVVTHRWDSDEFVSIKVSSDGVDTNSFITSKAGTVHTGTNASVGCMKISPDGSKLALAINSLNKFEIFDFDDLTGKVTNAISSQPIYNKAYGIEFSPDGQFLYGSTTFIDGSEDSVSYLYQFDVNAGNNIFNTGVVLGTSTLGDYFCGLQLGTDGRIYIARNPNAYKTLGVIYNPKRPGIECNFNYLDGSITGFDLAGKGSRYGLPEFIQSYFDLPHFDVEEVCFSDTTILKLQNYANVQSVSWNFDDPSSGSNTSTSLQPVHIFSGPGEYNVTVTENGTYTYQEKVIINELPMPALPDTAYMYRGATILLNAGDGFASYEWSTGENSSTIKVSEPGTYYVTVQNQRCCFNVDSVKVLLFDVMVPNAFRPGGTNNVFKAVPTSDEAISNFTMQIYNRWGQLMFESKDLYKGWDGNINGNPAPGDVYVWIIFYDVEREGNIEKVAYKGNVVLLR